MLKFSFEFFQISAPKGANAIEFLQQAGRYVG